MIKSYKMPSYEGDIRDILKALEVISEQLDELIKKQSLYKDFSRWSSAKPSTIETDQAGSGYSYD